MKIIAVDVIPVDLPMTGQHKNALASYNHSRDVYVRIRTDEGLTGYGATAPRYYITGETQASAVAVLRETLVPAVLGLDPTNITLLHQAMERATHHNTAAKLAIDLACWDLKGKALGVPVSQLLGGAVRTSAPVFELLPLVAPERAAEAALAFYEKGVRDFKVKAGPDPQQDIRRVEAVARVVPGSSLKVDANQSWRPKEAVRIAQALAALGVSVLEQPVDRLDLEGLARVTREASLEIMADEAVGSPQELMRLVRMEAADAFNIKLIKAGGLHQARWMADIAAAAGLPCMAGCTLQNLLVDTATTHFLAVTPNALWHEIKGPTWIAKDVAAGLRVEGGAVHVPTGPGLGVQIDEEYLQSFEARI